MASTKGEKVEQRLKQLDKSTAWLAKKLSVPRQSVHNWINGGTPRDDKVWEKIAETIKMPLDVLQNNDIDLTTDQEEDVPVTVVKAGDVKAPLRAFIRGDLAYIPVWRGVAAGMEEECYFVDTGSPEFAEIPAFLVNPEHLHKYMLCIPAGTSMSPRAKQGDRVLAILDSNPPPNSIVVAVRPDQQKYIKVLRERKHLELHSLNAAFKPIVNVEGWVVQGSVIAIWHRYEPGTPNIEFDDGRPLRA